MEKLVTIVTALAVGLVVGLVVGLAVGLVVGGALTEGPGIARTAAPPQDPGTSSPSDGQGGAQALDEAAP
ncbi:hypothetical protein [Streptomyces sp. NPDC056983]|uniref:hypothetical protein n=1 Tax=Streptomyces sp. NPDC056983 TaxID=3345987 RepID=UPI00363AB4C2